MKPLWLSSHCMTQNWLSLYGQRHVSEYLILCSPVESHTGLDPHQGK